MLILKEEIGTQTCLVSGQQPILDYSALQAFFFSLAQLNKVLLSDKFRLMIFISCLSMKSNGVQDLQLCHINLAYLYSVEMLNLPCCTTGYIGSLM